MPRLRTVTQVLRERGGQEHRERGTCAHFSSFDAYLDPATYPN
jgi:hypothetical protein